MKRMAVRQKGMMFDIADNRPWSMMRIYTEQGRAETDYSEVTTVEGPVALECRVPERQSGGAIL
jgi:hypothetical protein